MGTRRRTPGEQLPALGEWDGPIHGQLGVLAADGDLVQCHACAGWYRSLASHAWLVHGLTAAGYRAIFGLRARTALVGAALRTRRRELAAARLRAYQPMHAHFVTDQTHEERSRRRRGAVLALEARLDPANRERWRRLAERAGARRRDLLRDPAYRSELGRRLSEAKDGRAEVSCTICGTLFSIKRSALTAFEHHLCGQACIGEFRRRWTAELRRRPRAFKVEGVCAVCGGSFRGRRGQRYCSRRCNNRAKKRRAPGVCRTCGGPFVGEKGQRFCSVACSARFPRPEANARVSAAARQRGRPHAAELGALDAAAFESLPPLVRRLVRRYYGLDDGRPWSLRELARAEHVEQVRLTRLIAEGVAEVLRDR